MNKFAILIKWAIRFTFVAILWTYLEKVLGYHTEKINNLFSFGLIFGVVYLITYYLTLAEVYAKVYHHKIGYKSAFMNLAVLTIIIAFLSPLPHMVMHNYVSPDFFDNAIAMHQNKSPEYLENAKKHFTLTSYVFNGIQNTLSIGILFSTIIPLIFNNHKSPKQQDDVKTNKKLKRKYQSTKKI